MTKTRSIGEKLFDSFNILFLCFITILCIAPITHVLFASFSDPLELTKYKGLLLKPQGFTFLGYKLVLQNPSILSGYLNTLFYVIFGTAINLLLTSIGAYVLSRKNLYFGKYLMYMVVFAMFFSGGLIPLYLVIQNIGIMHTRWAILLPGAISIWNLIVMRTSFKQIPDSVEESAKMDGANDFHILFLIIIPLSQSLMAVMALFYGVGHWNSWFNASIFLNERSMLPLQVILREILILNDTNQMLASLDMDSSITTLYKPLVKYCTIIVATAPILCAYPFLQKYFVKGVMIGSLKE